MPAPRKPRTTPAETEELTPLTSSQEASDATEESGQSAPEEQATSSEEGDAPSEDQNDEQEEEETAPEAPEEQAAPASADEPLPIMRVRVKQTSRFWYEGMHHDVREGDVLNSQHHPLETLHQQKIGMDVLDEDGDVICDYGDL